MRHCINEQVVLLCMPEEGPEGPLAPYLRPFAKSLSQQGYTHKYLRRQVMLAACFSHWLMRRRVSSRCITSEHSSRYLRYRHRQRQANSGDPAALTHLIAFLRTQRVLLAPRISTPAFTAAQRCARAYGQYLRRDRALAKSTIVNYVPFIRDFLDDRFGAGEVKLSHLSAAEVVRFVQSRAPRLHVKRAKLMTTALRSFFQYARLRGAVKLDLAAAVPIVANWSMASIPRAIAPEQTQKLLASIDRKTAAGRRDYAILLLLARLGLRSGEVASLELDDVDWSAGHLGVRGKGGRRTEMPLPAEVGAAIAAYLRRGRPQCSSRRVFLRTKAPIRAFQGASGVGSIVRHRLLRAGITAPTYGAHQFRHGLASDMLRKGASLAEIGALLGHHHPDTTRIYTKIDLKALRTLAQPWPGGAR
ncbi:MAG: site-specific integrase [Steroidobacteraceae bacterium]|jgi:integrase/recombinase XerD